MKEPIVHQDKYFRLAKRENVTVSIHQASLTTFYLIVKSTHHICFN